MKNVLLIHSNNMLYWPYAYSYTQWCEMLNNILEPIPIKEL